MGGVIKGGGWDSGYGWRVGMELWVVRVGLKGNMVMWGLVGKVSIRRLRFWCLRQYSVTELAKHALDVFRIV